MYAKQVFPHSRLPVVKRSSSIAVVAMYVFHVAACFTPGTTASENHLKAGESRDEKDACIEGQSVYHSRRRYLLNAFGKDF